MQVEEIKVRKFGLEMSPILLASVVFLRLTVVGF